MRRIAACSLASTAPSCVRPFCLALRFCAPARLTRRPLVELGLAVAAALENGTCLGEQPHQRLQIHRAQLKWRMLEMLVGHSEVSIAEVQFDRGRVLAHAALELLPVLGAHHPAQRR